MIIGLQDRVDDFLRTFTYDDGQWYFQPRDFDTRLQISEEELVEAEDRFRFRFKVATAFTWIFVVGAMAWIYLRVIMDDWSLLAFFGVIPLALVASIFYIWAGASSVRQLRRRLWDAEVEHRLGLVNQGRPSRQILPRRKALMAQVAFICVLVAALSSYTAWQYTSNIRMLNEGTLVAANVTRSDDDGPKSKCVVEYAYELKGKSFEGDLIDCDTMNAHPVGSSLAVRVDPERPEKSIETSESPWPGEVAILLIMVPLLLLTLVTL